MKTNFAIRIRSKEEYENVMSEMIGLGYRNDKLWNDKQISKSMSLGHYLTSVKGDTELSLFYPLGLIEEYIYETFEDFKFDLENGNN